MQKLIFPSQSEQSGQSVSFVSAADELYKGIVSTIRESFIVLSVELRVLEANPAFYETFLVDPRDTEGHLLYELGNGQWDIPQLRQLLEKILTQHTEIRGFEVEHDFEGIGQKTMLLNARQINLHDASVSLILLAFEDITERRRSERALRLRLDRRPENRSRSASEQVLAEIIHQLNNPLGVILGYSELALKEDLPPNAREFIENVKFASQRAAGVVDEFVSLAEVSRHDRTRIEVPAVLERVIGLKSPEWKDNNIQVSREFVPDLPSVLANPFQLMEALIIIVTNAQQAMTEAHGRGHIILRAYALGDRIRISIEDNGAGDRT